MRGPRGRGREGHGVFRFGLHLVDGGGYDGPGGVDQGERPRVLQDRSRRRRGCAHGHALRAWARIFPLGRPEGHDGGRIEQAFHRRHEGTDKEGVGGRGEARLCGEGQVFPPYRHGGALPRAEDRGPRRQDVMSPPPSRAPRPYRRGPSTASPWRSP